MEISYYHKALVVAVIAVFYTYVPPYIYGVFGSPLEWKHWMMVFWVLALPVILTHATSWNALGSPIMGWVVAYVVMTLTWFALSSQSDMSWQEVRNRLMAILEILSFLLIFWEPVAARLARKTLVGAVIAGAVINIYEIFFPMSFSAVLGRSAGLYGNPTQAGEALVLGMIVCVTVLEPKYRGPFMLLTGIGIFTTFSRAAILGWVIAVAGLLFVRKLSLKDFLPSVFVGLVLGLLILLPYWDTLLTTWDRNGVSNSNVEERLAWFSDPSGVSDYSSWERKYLAQRAWEKIAERPILGSGTGSSYAAYTAPHNQYLSFMLDHGLIGALVIPMLLVTIMWGAQGETKQVAIVFSCVVLVLCFFTHTILNTTYSLVLFSLMTAMTATSSRYEMTNSRIRETRDVRTAQVLVQA